MRTSPLTASELGRSTRKRKLILDAAATAFLSHGYDTRNLDRSLREFARQFIEALMRPDTLRLRRLVISGNPLGRGAHLLADVAGACVRDAEGWRGDGDSGDDFTQMIANRRTDAEQIILVFAARARQACGSSRPIFLVHRPRIRAIVPRGETMSTHDSGPPWPSKRISRAHAFVRPRGLGIWQRIHNWLKASIIWSGVRCSDPAMRHRSSGHRNIWSVYADREHCRVRRRNRHDMEPGVEPSPCDDVRCGCC